MQLAQQIFTYMQLASGVTDATLGDSPGSLQSGIALEGLQEGANQMNRSRASRLEDFYTRFGNKLMAGILQFYPSERVVSLSGPTAYSMDYTIKRSEFFKDDKGQDVSAKEKSEILRDFRLHIEPGSSQPGARNTRAKAMMQFAQIRAASRLDVLLAADIPRPMAEQMMKDAEADTVLGAVLSKGKGSEPKDPR